MHPIPVKSAELSTESQIRYIVIDSNGGKVLDDASGFGFTSAENAMRHYMGFQRYLDDILAREKKQPDESAVVNEDSLSI